MAGREGRANRREVSCMVEAEEGRVIGRLEIGSSGGGERGSGLARIVMEPHLFNYGGE